MKKASLYIPVAVIAAIGLSFCIHKHIIKCRIDEYMSRVSSKVVSIDSLSLQRTMLDTSYIFRYAKLNDSNIEQYLDDWRMVSKTHQSKNRDTSLTMLYDKVIDYCINKMTVRDSLYGSDNVDFSKTNIADTSEFYVIPENVRIHRLHTGKFDKEWYWHIDACSDSISYDVPIVENGKPVLYMNETGHTVLSNYLSWIYEWRGDAYYEERNIEREKVLDRYIPVRQAGELPGHYRFYSAPIISDIYHCHGEILLDVRTSAYYMETLLMKDWDEDFEVIHIYQ